MVEDIISRIDDNWDDFTKARFIYIELGKILEYDPIYIFGPTEAKKTVYYKEFDLDNPDTNKVVCKGWSMIYLNMLKRIGIKGDISSDFHSYVTFSVDKYLIHADATMSPFLDLSRIKAGYETAYYIDLNDNADFLEKLKEADMEIGYCKSMYTNELIDKLRSEFIESEDLELKFNIITKIINLTNSNFSYIDCINYFKELEHTLLTKEEREKESSEVFYKLLDGDLEVDEVISVGTNSNDLYIHYNEKNKTLKLISPSKYQEIKNKYGK